MWLIAKLYQYHRNVPEMRSCKLATFLLQLFPGMAHQFNGMKGLFSTSIFGIIFHNSFLSPPEGDVFISQNQGSVVHTAFSAYWEGLLKVSS